MSEKKSSEWKKYYKSEKVQCECSCWITESKLTAHKKTLKHKEHMDKLPNKEISEVDKLKVEVENLKKQLLEVQKEKQELQKKLEEKQIVKEEISTLKTTDLIFDFLEDNFKTVKLSKITVERYLSQFKKICTTLTNKEDITIKDLPKEKDVLKHIKTIENLQSRQTKLNSYRQCLKRLNIKSDLLDEEFNKLFVDNVNNAILDGTNEKEKAQELHQDELKALREEYNKLRETEAKPQGYSAFKIPKYELYYLLACLYTMIEPLRGQDYYNSYVFDDSSKEDVKDKNYCCIKSKKLVLVNYKTAKAHGKREIKLNDDIIKVIKEFHDKYKNEYLVVTQKNEQFTQANFSKVLKECTKKCGSQILRKTFVGDLIDSNDENIKEKRIESAKIMGHNLHIQNSFYGKYSKSRN